jgi:hypothetical protein
MILIISVVVACDNSTSITSDDFSAVFPSAEANLVESNFVALQYALNSLNASMAFASVSQKAAFLGSIAFNTANLMSHQARCANDNSCDLDRYMSKCSSKTTPDNMVYLPRGAMMVSSACAYIAINEFIQNNSIVGALKSVVDMPELLNTDLNYSYMSAVAVWMIRSTHKESCLTITNNSLANFSECLVKINAWECTPAGYRDQINRLSAITTASERLGAEVSSDMIASMFCNTSPETAMPNPINNGSMVSPIDLPKSHGPRNSTKARIAPNSSMVPRFSGNNSPMPRSSKSPRFSGNNSPMPRSSKSPLSIKKTPLPNMPMRKNATMGRRSSSSPRPSEMACGAISESVFNRTFVSNSNATLLRDNFQAMMKACEVAGIVRMDISQASMMLAAIAINTANFTVANNSRDNGDLDTPRGVMLLVGESSYASFTAYTTSLALQYDSFVTSPEQISNDIFLSYLSGIFVMTVSDDNGNSAMAFASAGMFIDSFMFMNSYSAMNFSESNQDEFLNKVEFMANVIASNGPAPRMSSNSTSSTDEPIENGVRTNAAPVMSVQILIAALIIMLTL